jgi:outer membrane lipoprotein-sorting protein
MRSTSSLRPHRGRLLRSLAVILLAGLATACGGGEQQPSAKDIVDRAASATRAQKSFHFVFDEKNGPKSTTGVHLVFAEGDIAVPDKVKADVSGTFQGLPLRSQLVVAGGKYYLKDPFTGKWREVSINTNPIAFFDPAKGVLAVITNATKLELVGSEKVGGADTYHLKGKTTVGSITPLLGNPPGTRLVDVELWVDKETDLLARLRLSGPVEKGDPTGAVRTIEASRYGVAVPIVAPQTGT